MVLEENRKMGTKKRSWARAHPLDGDFPLIDGNSPLVDG